MIRHQSTISSTIGNINDSQTASDAALQADTDLGDDDTTENTGVIKKEKEETLLYFDHIFPYISTKWDLTQYLFSSIFFSKNENYVKNRILDLCKTDLDPINSLNITSIQLMKRDGGAFVKFQVPIGETVQNFNKKILKNVSEKQRNFNLLNYFIQPRCFPVKGIPWIEDLRRFPTNKIKISFRGPDLTQEELYLLFRRYGLIHDIIPPKPDSKDIPRFAFIIFRSARAAIAAKNCINGLKLNDTILHIQYEKIFRENLIRNFLFEHTRLAIPAILALTAALAFIIFEPIREWCVKEKISQRYSLKNSTYYKKALEISNFTTSKFKEILYYEKSTSNIKSASSLWAERYQKIKELKLWIEENVNTFIIVQGPRGSGKHEMVVDHTLRGRENVLILDCDSLLNARNDTKLIQATSQQLGYFPVFPWLNSISTFIDLGVQGLTGQKSGISESKEQAVKNMLNTSLMAIRDLSLEHYSSEVVVDNSEKIGSGSSQEKTTYVLKEEDYLQQHPECKPVVVIDRFQPTRKASERNAFVYKEIADWAANLISMNVAHVIFISDDIGSPTFLSDSLPNQIFKVSTLSDASEENAKQYVLSQLHDQISSPALLKELDTSIKPLGGRMLDLQAYIRRIKSGESPQEALSEMINQTAEQLTQMFINRNSSEFQLAHAWIIMKALGSRDSISFGEIAVHPLFKGKPNEILSVLERMELILLIKDRGLVKEIRAGKPLFKASFNNLISDEKIFKEIEIKYNFQLIGFENDRISGWVEEINKFGEYGDLSNSKIYKPRLEYLAEKIRLSTEAIINAEKQISYLSK
ncbi:hypothetical protein PACTADRAFT_42226 [Pachysolen tannophilus NRRL Y-2460]|uniref:Mitochondrial escape protein 2 n=1 Tax=Pachysolen tannophilus NRRL Y-2460 TaxID=669874 RepID=A0A1E4TV40_PACTA|nr:hypothetical protein PACTADRAFT_42226 [Pachysolen tannophilus NRRL Y-2460]